MILTYKKPGNYARAFYMYDILIISNCLGKVRITLSEAVNLLILKADNFSNFTQNPIVLRGVILYISVSLSKNCFKKI